MYNLHREKLSLLETAITHSCLALLSASGCATELPPQQWQRLHLLAEAGNKWSLGTICGLRDPLVVTEAPLELWMSGEIAAGRARKSCTGRQKLQCATVRVAITHQ